MRRTRLNFGKLDWTNLLEMAAVGILLAGGFPVRSVGRQQGQKTFSSPDEASNALVTAAQNNDEEAMLDVLGPDGKQVDETVHFLVTLNKISTAVSVLGFISRRDIGCSRSSRIQRSLDGTILTSKDASGLTLPFSSASCSTKESVCRSNEAASSSRTRARSEASRFHSVVSKAQRAAAIAAAATSTHHQPRRVPR